MNYRTQIVQVGRMLGVTALLTLAVSLGAANPSGETGDLSQRYAAIAPITLVPQEGLQRLSLPLPVLQASLTTSWADVRVLDATGRPVPIAWLPSTPATSAENDASLTSAPLPRFAWPSAASANNSMVVDSNNDLRVQVNSAGAVVKIESSRPAQAAPTNAAAAPRVWLLDLSALPRPGRPIAQLQLDWPASAQGLSSRVEVEGSDDAQRWSPITSGPLLELPAMNAVAAASDASTASAPTQLAPSVKHVDWPAGAPMPRYLRLRFEQPLALSHAQLRWSPATPPVQLNTTTVQFQAVAAYGPEPAHWTLDLQGAVPVQQLQLNLPQINTVLGLRLEQRNHEREPWHSVANLVAWRLLRDGKEEQSSPVEWHNTASASTPTIAAPAARHWRLVPHARTAQLPAQPLSATIGWQSPQLLLVAQGESPLRLAVGRERDAVSTIAWQTLVPGADDTVLKHLPQASVGALTTQMLVEPNLNQRMQSATPEDQRRWLLWGVLGLAVVGLGGLAWKLSKDMREPLSKNRSDA